MKTKLSKILPVIWIANALLLVLVLLVTFVFTGDCPEYYEDETNESYSEEYVTPDAIVMNHVREVLEEVFSEYIAVEHPEVYVDGFPVLEIFINSEEPIDWNVIEHYSLQDIRENWTPATLSISNTSEAFELDSIEVLARGRGNSTWQSFGAKRPLRFRFPEGPQAILDSAHTGRDWVTFANAADPSHMRNFAAYHLASQLSFGWTPQTWFVHLYLDSEYWGVYLLLDEREATPGRGDLYLHEDPTISEYMVEFDVRTRWDGDPVNSTWVDIRHSSFDIRWPSTSAWMDEVDNPHALYVEDYLSRVDDAIVARDREALESLIDLETFVDMYLIQEFTKNQDSTWSSLFFQIRGQGEERRLYAGPVWDFDLSAGATAETLDHTQSRAINTLEDEQRLDWWYHLNQADWFMELAHERWLEIRDVEVRNTIDEVARVAIEFEEDFNRDFERWPLQGTGAAEYGWHSSELTRSVRGHLNQVEALLSWYEMRIMWLNSWLNG